MARLDEVWLANWSLDEGVGKGQAHKPTMSSWRLWKPLDAFCELPPPLSSQFSIAECLGVKRNQVSRFRRVGWMMGRVRRRDDVFGLGWPCLGALSLIEKASAYLTLPCTLGIDEAVSMVSCLLLYKKAEGPQCAAMRSNARI